ncbi:DNase I-like protein [Poronia punctata]|nr:DNase I-like protein [Poronia punctata]
MTTLTMPTSELDVFVLTFNAGKEHINPRVFARHLRDAFSQNATTLPDVVVFSLQEMAPLANAFIGGSMIKPYFQSYTSALNLATSESMSSQSGKPPYTLVHWHNVGMTGIMLFCHDRVSVLKLQSSVVGFGAGDMANKGAAGIRVHVSKEGQPRGRMQDTELTFVSAHLAAMEWNLEKRNQNWRSIVSGLLFEDPRRLLDTPTVRATPRTPSHDSETDALLEDDEREAALQEISIYKPGSHLFVAGDLNYRISKTSPAPDSQFPDLDPNSPNYFARFLAQDQLATEIKAGRTLHGLSEAAIKFPPTYKLELEEGPASGRQQNDADVVDWSWAKHRWPGWCDRVLYLDIPPWVDQATDKEKIEMKVMAYNSLPPVRTSDHRPVFLRIGVPLVGPSVLAPPDSIIKSDSTDPRVRLPYPVDPQAWEHRKFVKGWESVIGWSMLFSESRWGIAFFTTVLLVGLGTWWLRSK